MIFLVYAHHRNMYFCVRDDKHICLPLSKQSKILYNLTRVQIMNCVLCVPILREKPVLVEIEFFSHRRNPVSPPLSCAKHIYPPNLILSASPYDSPYPLVHAFLAAEPRPFPYSYIRPNLILRRCRSCGQYS